MRAIGHYRPMSTTSTHTKLNNGGIHMLSIIKERINILVTTFKAEYNAQRTSMVPTPAPAPTATPTTFTSTDYETLITTMLHEHNLSADLYVRSYMSNGMVMCVMNTEDKATMNIHIRTHTDTLLVVDPHAVKTQYHALVEAYPTVFGTLTIKDIATIIAAHELGHIKAKHLHGEGHLWMKAFIASGGTVTTHRADYMKMGQIAINQELEAWGIGKQYVSACLLDAYNAFNRNNVNVYKSMYNAQLGTITYK